MQIWFTHKNEIHVAEDLPGSALPILDRNDQQHIVRWGASVGDDDRFPRGMWYRESFLSQCRDAIWVRIPALRYRQNTMYKGPLTVELDEPIAGALFRIPGLAPRVLMVASDAITETTIAPVYFSQLKTNKRS